MTFPWGSPMARSCRSSTPEKALLALGASPSTATTMCGWPIRLAARSRSSAAHGRRTARPAQGPRTRISPPGGYIGGLQIITDVAVDPAGNLWVANNWDRPEQGFNRFGGNGTVVFFGLAKPVRTPLIGPPRPAL